MICVDTSEWQRNGDFAPSRMDAQHDAVNLLANTKTMQHPETSVGVLSGSGRPRVLMTLTQEVGALLQALHGVKLGGEFCFVKSLQVAQLALKNRQNKNQHQRVVMFVGSPINDSERDMVRAAKQMKKNGIAVDVVVFGGMGEEFGSAGEDQGKQQEGLVNKFIEACAETSRLLVVPPGTGGMLSDLLRTSTVIQDPDTDAGDDTGGAGAGADGVSDADRFAEWGGIDPSQDPELAAAMRASLMESAQPAAEEQPSAPTEQPTTPTAAGGSDAPRPDDALDAVMDAAAEDQSDSGDDEGYDEEAELAAALAMSMADGGQDAPATGGDAEMDGDSGDDDYDEEEELRLAMAMSMADNKEKEGDK